MEYYSNTFPKPIKEVVKKAINEAQNLNDRSRFILLGLKENCPNLYKFIMSK